MRLRRKTAVALIAAVFFILLGSAAAYAPDSTGPQHQSFIGADDAQVNSDPVLIIDGEEFDVTGLFNSQIKLFNGQAAGALKGSNPVIDSTEKRLRIVINDTIVDIQFLNAAPSRAQDYLVLKCPGSAQAALVITGPQVDMVNDHQIEVTTLGSGKKRLCFLLDLENEAGHTIINNMSRVSFPGKTSHFSFLVNGDNPLAKDYVPSNLVAIPKTVPARQNKNNMQLSGEAVFYLGKMLQQAQNEGVGSFVLTSTYRSYSYQSMLFKNKVNQLKSEERAAQIVARPGTSEHQTGLAVDFTAGGQGLNESFVRTFQGKWLNENSWKYGFILRYPKDKTGITKIIYEPWHFRYVGYPYSKIMHDRHLCLEEYTQNLRKYGFYAVSDKNNTYLVVFNPGDQKVYLSGAVSKTPEL